MLCHSPYLQYTRPNLPHLRSSSASGPSAGTSHEIHADDGPRGRAFSPREPGLSTNTTIAHGDCPGHYFLARTPPHAYHRRCWTAS